MRSRSQQLAHVALYAVAFVGLAGLAMLTGCTKSVRPVPSGGSHLVTPDPAAEMLGDKPPTARTLFTMSEILVAQGKDKECEFVLSACIRQHPGFAPAYNSLAELQMRQGRVAEAMNVLSAALKHWPEDPVLLNNRGMCSLICQDYETALTYFTQAAAHAPEGRRYQGNMATCLGMLGRDAEALSLLRQILPEEQATHNASVLRKARQKALEASSDTITG